MRKVVTLLFISAVLFTSTVLSAQQKSVVRPNYKQAEFYSPSFLRERIYSTSVSPQWIGETDRFWYSYRTSADGVHWSEPLAKPAVLGPAVLGAIKVSVMLKQLPEGDGHITDIHRFWEQTGSFYMTGQGEENLADPYIGLGVIPASTGVFRDMTAIRYEYPQFVAENCTGTDTEQKDYTASGFDRITNDLLDQQKSQDR